MKYIRLFSIFFIIFAAALWFRFQHLKPILHIPIHSYPFKHQPCIDISIENKQYRLLLDLGSAHFIYLNQSSLQSIKNKRSLKSSIYHDLRGNTYTTREFQIPLIHLFPNAILENVIIAEENMDFLLKGSSLQKTQSIIKKLIDRLELFFIDGRIGSKVFENSCCFFDFPQSRFNWVQEKGSLPLDLKNRIKQMVQIPFNLTRYGAVIELMTNQGNKKFLLDTGSTHSVFRNFSNQINLFTFLKSNENDLGMIKLISYDLDTEIEEFDAVLGFDFLQSRSLCIDFVEGYVYL